MCCCSLHGLHLAALQNKQPIAATMLTKRGQSSVSAQNQAHTVCNHIAYNPYIMRKVRYMQICAFMRSYKCKLRLLSRAQMSGSIYYESLHRRERLRKLFLQRINTLVIYCQLQKKANNLVQFAPNKKNRSCKRGAKWRFLAPRTKRVNWFPHCKDHGYRRKKEDWSLY